MIRIDGIRIGPSGSHLSIRGCEGGAGGSLYISRGVSLSDVLLLDGFARRRRIPRDDGRGRRPRGFDRPAVRLVE